MSVDLQTYLRERARAGETPLGLGVAVAVVIHALVFVPFLLPHRGEETPKEKITWVSLPASMPAGPSGGAAGTEQGEEKGQRLRRADEVAPERSDAKAGSITQQDPFATKVSPGAIKGNNKDTTSKGTNTTAAKSPTPSPVPQGGAAGSGNAGGLGAGSDVAWRGPNNGTGGQIQVGLEGPAFEYGYYGAGVESRIRAALRYAPNAQGRVQVYFRIKRDGQLDRSPMVSVECTNDQLNTFARMAVLRSAPFAPLPNDYAADWLGVYIWITFSGN